LTALLEFEGVACERGGRQLFAEVSFSLGGGDALWVRGSNGAGKSSLLRLAAGLLKAATGSVHGSPAALADEALALDEEMRLERALRWWARMDGSPEKVREALAAFGLLHLADVPVRMLSTGQARRARLARVLTTGAPLWLLDEPLNGLDSEGVEALGRVLERHRSEGGAVLTASHVPLPGAGWRELELGL
jgi:heme exporter protein A